MPYGLVTEKMQFKFGALPSGFLREFLLEAKISYPNECAAWFIWNESDGSMRFESGCRNLHRKPYTKNKNLRVVYD